MKKNVLVFPCGSEVGLELHRSLFKSTHFNLIGGSSVPDHGMFTYETYIDNLPQVDDAEFVSVINKICQEHSIDFIFPAHDSVVLKLALAKDKGELIADVVTSPAETCEIARSKFKTYELLHDIIAVPKLFQAVEEITDSDFPVFLKPNVGQGSKGTQKANTMEEIEFYCNKDPSLLIMEFLPGQEFTIDCFTDKNGALQFCEGRVRNRINNGISVNSSTVIDKRFKDIAKKINSHLDFQGAWFFQLKENYNKELVLMEIAPRIAGTMGLVRCKGVNLALLSLFDKLEYPVSIFENDYELVIDRALENKYRHNISYNHVYLDFDDLVIFEGKINTAVMAFVYQCVNNGVKIHLLTKHRDDLAKTLKKYRLTDTFDEVIWIQDESEKHLRITEKDAILIDDSFTEREAVYRESHIPVFDAHMIESLMEY